MDLASHSRKVEHLQKEMRALLSQREAESDPPCISLRYSTGSSFTTRSKAYKKNCAELNCESFNEVWIDPERSIAYAEPRVTMEELVRAALRHGLTPTVVPEIRDITVGGAVMGMGGESASHRWGCFNDACTAFEILKGDGALLRATPDEHPDLFYGIPGSYGSLGPLLLAEIRLVPAKECIHLRYTSFADPLQAVGMLRKLASSSESPEFLDGIVLAKNLAVVIEGNFCARKDLTAKLPTVSCSKASSQYYFQHVKEIAAGTGSTVHEELMAHEDYYFRYDKCAFWMGMNLFHLTFLTSFIGDGMLKLFASPREGFTEAQIERLRSEPRNNAFSRLMLSPFLSSRALDKMLHSARTEKWMQDRFIIQDFCLPENAASQFLSEAIERPAVFPIWLLPIKGTKHPQVFAPHLLSKEADKGHFINVGIYGLPACALPIRQLTRELEQKAKAYGGRKVLYSRSYYTKEEFWSIYSFHDYIALREKTLSAGIFHDITDKVLSA